ncbi:hypothetical protein BS47DRAFT_338216 [Hydnum rufescens UP504]|uniref:Uncharacterized protein n=1 Tax=Hydnum rufescens UP504 TaxID=1448309 RepID=A0A9P6ALV2_9AGAM|nr:hypothetical protein BS47DRAFT_338216 [Hydnum rufescens UP504]
MSNIELLLCTANKEWAVVLSIPLSEVRRLSLRPLKWLTFVAFAICGAEGHLCVNRLGEHANYNATSTDPLAKEYYYFNQGQYHLVDHSTLNDRITSSTKTPRCSGFRKDLMARDGDCCTISELQPIVVMQPILFRPPRITCTLSK